MRGDGAAQPGDDPKGEGILRCPDSHCDVERSFQGSAPDKDSEERYCFKHDPPMQMDVG